MKTLDRLFLEREIIKIAKELNIKDRYINNMLDKYYGLWLIDNKSRGRFVLLGMFKKEDGKDKQEQVKVIKNYKKEAIKKLEILTQLFRMYKALKEVEELSQILFIQQQTEEEKEEALTTSKEVLTPSKV